MENNLRDVINGGLNFSYGTLSTFYTVSQKVHLVIFQINLSKIDRFLMIFVC